MKGGNERKWEFYPCNHFLVEHVKGIFRQKIPKIHCIWCQTPLIAIPTGKCFQTNQDNLQTEAFKSIQAWKMDRFKRFFSFFLKIAGCFVYFSTKNPVVHQGASDFLQLPNCQMTYFGKDDLPLRVNLDLQLSKYQSLDQEPWECWLSRDCISIFVLQLEGRGQTGELKPNGYSNFGV